MRAGPAIALLLTALAAAPSGTHQELALHSRRSSPQDLVLSGDLAGLHGGAVRFVAYEDLLKLPQQILSAKDDANFPGGARLSGVPLDQLIRAIGVSGSGQLVAAICSDKYEAHYTVEYRAAHHPVLVLRIAGEPPADWSKIGRASYGPYLISHARFVPATHIPSPTDEPQIPYGVLELKFLPEDQVLDALRPRGSYAADSSVMQGYQTAFQNCFRCHNQGPWGGRKAGVDWEILARFAAIDPAGFAALVHDPKSINSSAAMPANPEYDAKALQALTAYFQAFDRQGSR